MKYCSQCGKQMQDEDRFCMKCGSASGEAGATGSKSVVLVSSPARKQVLSIKSKIIIGALLVIVLAIGGFWGWNTYGTEARVQRQLDLAVKYLSDNDYQEAVLAFNDAINIDPKEVKAYQGLAKTYTLQGNYDQAKNTYEKGMAAVTPQNKQILQLGLAGMYIDQNKLTEAQQVYWEIMNMSPDCLEAYWGMAMVYNQQGDKSKAETILKQAVEKNPNEYRGYNTLALLLFQNNKEDEALRNIAQSLTLEMNQQEAYLVLESIYQNNWAELRTQINSLSNQQTSDMQEFYSYYAAGDYINAINTYHNKLAIQSGNQKAKILASIAMAKNGDKPSAAVLIKQLDFPKLNGWLLGDLGRYYMAAGDNAKAREYAIKALQLEPANLDAIALLQTLSTDDPDVKIYTVKALLYNWKPVLISAAEMQKHNLSIGIIEKDLSEGDGFNEAGSAINQFNNEPTFTVTFSTRNISQTYINKAGVPIDVTLTLPELTGSYPGINTINDYFKVKQNEIINLKDRSYLNHGSPYQERYFIKAEYQLATQVENIISIRGDGNSFGGGVNNPVIYGDTFNLDTGNKLSLDDIFNISSGEYLNLIYSAVSKKINDDIVNRKSTEINMYYFEDVYGADGVKAVHDYNPNDWYLTNQSLVVVYQQGSLGPNSSGILSYEIPLDSIKDKLKISESIIK